MATSKLFGDKLTKCWEVTCDGQVSHPGGVEFYATETGDKRRSDGPSGSPNYDWEQTFTFTV